MGILAAVTATAIVRQLLLGDDGGMTRITIELRVRSLERILRFLRVIVGHRPPFLVVMAVVALCAEAPGVRIVGPVATVAILWDLVLVITGAVAGNAAHVGMSTQQRVTGLLQVVILRGFPLFRDMAFAAVVAP